MPRSQDVDEEPDGGRTPAPQSAYEERYWDTNLRGQHKITQGQAVEEYCLSRKDLQGLDFERKESTNRYEEHHYYKYNEVDVLRRAWDKYGGPDGLWAVLKDLRTKLTNQPVKLRAFDMRAPHDYRRGALYDLTKDFFTPPPSYLPYRRLSDKRKRIYDKLGRRRHDVCLAVLSEDTEWPASPDDAYTEELAEDGTAIVTATAAVKQQREGPAIDEALDSATDFFAAYPARPKKRLLLGSRPAVARAIKGVRAVLGQAPTAPVHGAAEWGRPAEKLDFVDEPFPGHYEWDAAFLERVFLALCALIERDPAAWEAIRWEVYDRYLSSVSLRAVLRYDAVQLLWFDTAAEWLVRQLPPEELWRSLRQKCPSGLRYDELLGERLQ